MAMKSEMGSQELQLQGKRNKIDGFTYFGAARPHNIDVNFTQRDSTSEPKTECDPRKSLVWDSAFFTSPGILEPQELYSAVNSCNKRNGFNILGHEEHMLLPPDFYEPQLKNRTDESSMRKRSLAWDSGFFTGEGVLDPEELSIVNRGFVESEMQLLPRIEDIGMSSGSKRTADSNVSSLASLEIELFNELRASRHKLSTVSGTAASTAKLGRERVSKKNLGSSQLGGKIMPASKRQAVSVTELGTTGSDTYVPQQRQLHAGNGEAFASLVLKPPKIQQRVNRILKTPPGKVSVTTIEVKGQNNIAKSPTGKSLNASTKPKLRDSALSPITANHSKAKHSPCKQLGYAPPSVVSKSLQKSPRRKTSQTTVSLDNLRSKCCTSLEYKMASKSQTDCLNHPSLSAPKLFPHVLPSTSIDGGSSGSLIPKCLSPTLGPFSERNQPIDTSHLEKQPDQSNNLNQGCLSPSPCTKRVLMGTDPSRNMKPSGLRIPSPKRGYFDEEDCPVPTDNGDWRTHRRAQIDMTKMDLSVRKLNGGKHKERKTEQAQNGASTILGTMKSPLAKKGQNELCCVGKSKDCLKFEKLTPAVGHPAEVCSDANLSIVHNMAQGPLRSRFVKQSKAPKTKRSQKEREDNKENLVVIESGVEGLSAQVKTLDLNGDVVIELKAKKSSS